MRADEETLDREAVPHDTGNCSRPYEVQPGLFIRCKSRVKSKCPSCAELYRGDWAAIARSGVFDGPVQNFQFYLLTLTAPSFGRVHRVPRSRDASSRACGCGAVHTVDDAGLRGVPLDAASYDYRGQVAWNRDSGLLWDRTRRRIRDRWDSTEFFIVREWQERGVLHVHVLLRISRAESPGAAILGEAARTAVAASKVDGTVIGWGDQSQCDAFRADGDGARTIWYLSKALNYVMKDTARGGLGGHNRAWTHLAQLDATARSMRCSVGCVPASCSSRVHASYGARSHVVSASRRTRHRTGWSFIGLTRTVQRRLRKAWIDNRNDQANESSSVDEEQPSVALEHLATRAGRGLRARIGAIP